MMNPSSKLMQPDLFKGITGPMFRNGDLCTSIEAARDASKKVSENQLLALRLIAESPKTDYDLERITGLQKNSIGKRRSDLYRAGLVEPWLDKNGEKIKRPGPSGSMCIVWCITKAGMAVWET